jgi:hypothetical protein
MRGLHLAGIEAICRRMTFLELPPLGILFQQGDAGDSMYMVLLGSCEIYKHYACSTSQTGTPAFIHFTIDTGLSVHSC